VKIMNLETWAGFKTTIAGKGLSMQFNETGSRYEVSAIEAGFYFWTHNLLKGSPDAVDFETNFKDTINQSVETVSISILKDVALADGVEVISPALVVNNSKKTWTVENDHGSGGLIFKIEASPNNVLWEEIVQETPLPFGGKVIVVNNDFWKYLRVTAKGDGAASSIDVWLQVGP